MRVGMCRTNQRRLIALGVWVNAAVRGGGSHPVHLPSLILVQPGGIWGMGNGVPPGLPVHLTSLIPAQPDGIWGVGGHQVQASKSRQHKASHRHTQHTALGSSASESLMGPLLPRLFLMRGTGGLVVKVWHPLGSLAGLCRQGAGASARGACGAGSTDGARRGCLRVWCACGAAGAEVSGRPRMGPIWCFAAAAACSLLRWPKLLLLLLLGLR